MKNKKKIESDYKKKIKKLLGFNKAYFEKDKPLASDSEFDKLKIELIKQSEKHPSLSFLESTKTGMSLYFLHISVIVLYLKKPLL